MKRNLLKAFLIIGIFTVFGAISANAQTDLPGKYVFEQKLANGQTNQIGFELKSENVAVYSKVNAALEESSEKTGSWAWNKSKKLLTVTIPATKNVDEDDATEVKVIFKLNGKNLKVASVSPKETGKIGDVFKKI